MKKAKVVEFVGVGCSGKTTTKNKLFSDKEIKEQFIDHAKIGASRYKSTIMKGIYSLQSSIFIFAKYPKIMLPFLKLILEDYTIYSKDFYHRLFTFIMVMEKIHKGNKLGKPIIFCESVLKSLCSVYMYSNKKADLKKIKKIERIYIEKEKPIFIYFDIPPKKSIKRMRQRQRKSDRKFLAEENKIRELKEYQATYDFFLKKAKEQDSDVYVVKGEWPLEKKKEAIKEILMKENEKIN